MLTKTLNALTEWNQRRLSRRWYRLAELIYPDKHDLMTTLFGEAFTMLQAQSFGDGENVHQAVVYIDEDGDMALSAYSEAEIDAD